MTEEELSSIWNLALRDLLQVGAAKERALLVKWLRDPYHKSAGSQFFAEVLVRLAGIIEDKAHHRPADEQWVRVQEVTND